ncbi:MAG: prepilin-type N-terminal cleavage/methylation domain-containing protein [SAR324 cluster bacterium]|nr:prepilin-type N-terminal cleavage/methylation domain-containing protein [SAR324 cluster bacterium]
MKPHPYPEKRGFTLMEIALSLALLSVVIGITTPIVSTLSSRANFVLTYDKLALIEQGLTLYNQDIGDFPPAVVDLVSGAVVHASLLSGGKPVGLVALIEQPTTATLSFGGLPPFPFEPITWQGPYLSGYMPNNLWDAWGMPFQYTPSAIGVNVVSANNAPDNPHIDVSKASANQAADLKTRDVLRIINEQVQLDMQPQLDYLSGSPNPADAINFLINSTDMAGVNYISAYYRKDPWGQPFLWHPIQLQFYSTGPNRIRDGQPNNLGTCNYIERICSGTLGDDIDGF